MRILHVLDRLSGAGPTRALLALVKHQGRLGLAHEHRAVTLRREAYPVALVLARQAGLVVLRAPEPGILREELAAADIVQVHFWNNPDLWAFLRADLPPVRMLVWSTVLGEGPPQVISPGLVDLADGFVATSPRTLTLPVLAEAVRDGRAWTIPATADLDRLGPASPRTRDAFHVGYVGTVNFTKMHPEFVSMSARIAVPGVRIVVAGGGEQEQLRQQAERLGAADRFDFRGFVENVGAVYETLDVFGYPLCPGTFATCELVLQEAMSAGVPPVVLPHGGVAGLVEDGRTGIVAADPEEYVRAVERLYHDPAQRQRLGRNARDHAREHFAPEKAARRFDEVYRQMMERPRREHCGPGPAHSAAALFAEALGAAAPEFADSLAGPHEAAERHIAASSYLLAFGEGGILHYRNTHPRDPLLRFWSGLVLLGQGRREEAAREFQAAAALGLDPARTAPDLEGEAARA